MDPLSLIGGGLGAIGSIFGGSMAADAAEKGAQAQEYAANVNWQSNLLNYYQREQERTDRTNAAADAQMRQDEGGTDAAGNRQVYVPGKGWTTILTPQAQSILNAQNQEQTDRLGIDAPIRRNQLIANAQDQAQQRYLANNLLRHFGDTPDTATDEGNKLRLAASQGISDNYKQATDAAAHDALVTNSSQFGNVMKQLTQGRSQDEAKAFAGIPMQAQQIANQTNANHDSQLSNLYGFFSGKSSVMPQTQYAPSDQTTQPNSLMNADQSRSATADNSFSTAMGQKGGTMDYIQPNMGYANAEASIGNLISSGFGKFGSQLGNMGMYDSLRSRTAGGNSGTDDNS